MLTSTPATEDRDETARLAALDSYQILDTAPEQAFDDIVQIAAQICGVPMALISLVDDRRQWFKSALGLAATETPRSIAFCAHAIQQDEVFLVEDATQDARFAANPLVTSNPNLRFYAGAPLVTPDGYALGTLCVLDNQPRSLSPVQREALAALGRHVMTQLELRKSLAETRHSEARLKRLEAEALRDRDRIWALSKELMLVCDFAGLIVAANPAAFRILGYSHADMAGRNVAEFIHPDDAAITAAHLAKLAAGEPDSVENRYRAKDGTYRLLDWTAVPEARLVHAVARDITIEREAAADREHIWNSTNDLMATLDLDGRLRSVNPAWSRLLGYENEQLLGRPLIELILPEDRPKLASVLERLKSGNPVVNLEDHLVHQDGTQSLMAWSAEPVGTLHYLVGRNVTEQRATEDALRQSLKMEAVGQLTGGIAHDFNNLLQGIIGCLDLIRKRSALGKVDDVERFVSGAMSSANRAAALTHRLLAFSRRQPLTPQPLEANSLLASMEDLLRRTLGEHIQLELAVCDGLWPTKCDRNQLENAVLNLVINARDAMPDGGRLTIETANAQLDRASVARTRDMEEGQYVCISVTDTGSGMSADTIKKAFEPFFTTKPIGRGTGLGLSMIYGFAKQSGGYAKIYSDVGRGTTVKLYLPRFQGDLQKIAEGAAASLTDERDVRGHETVLVVEDELVVRALIVEVLSELGYRALEAEDGPSGLSMLQSDERIDLLITDIGLPGLNGRQIVEAGRQLRPELKVLFMTGYAENAAIAAGFLESGMSMITKPFSVDALATSVRDMLLAK